MRSRWQYTFAMGAATGAIASVVALAVAPDVGDVLVAAAAVVAMLFVDPNR